MKISKKIKILIALLVVTNFVAIGFLVWNIGNSKIDRFINNYPLIDFSRNFISQEHYVVNIQPLREKLNQMVDNFGRDRVSLYLEYLNTGANISINPELYVWPASLIKLPFVVAAMKKVEDGDWKLTNELVLMEGDRDDKSGSVDDPIWQYPVGTRFTIEKLISESLKNSDNTAHHILYRNIDVDELEDVIDSLGLEKLFTDEGKTSAKEYSRLFRSLYNATYLSRSSSQKILGWLGESTFKDFLAKPIPDDIVFAHKYGENIELQVFSDSGIVYLPNRPYMITVIVAGSPNVSWEENKRVSSEFMQEVSLEVYKYFSTYK